MANQTIVWSKTVTKWQNR